MLRAFTLALTLAAGPALATVIETSAGPMRIEPVLSGLDEPWGVAFLPDGDVLVTERAGRLLLASGGKAQAVSGGPQVRAAGQGGLLDALVPRDFATTREVWLAYSVGGSGGAATAIGKGRLSADKRRLEGFATLWTGDRATGGRHFGARLAEAPDGTLWLGTGDRGTGPDGMASQDPGSTIGKVLAFRRDGTPLPAARPGWAPGVQSIGHRNIQGMTFDAQGRLWASEHGARGGDEVNRIEPGRNYGWPAISYGTDYDGSKIGTGTEAPGLEQPRHVWDPSMAPSGLAAYDGALIPQWRGHILAGSLKFDHITRLDPGNGWAEEILQSPETGRVRDVRQGPDGAIWFLSVTEGALFRMAPATP
jgi:glucose/arabinose dehydrogenase